MSSDIAMPKEVFSERLAKMRDATLVENENIVAQQMGDTGQAVVLTSGRLIILKAGLSATGSIDGHSVTALSFDEIEAVNLRRGPMGAVIQVVGKSGEADDRVRPPENMAVFSAEAKIKKLETLVDKFANLSKLSVNRVEWEPANVSDVKIPVSTVERAPQKPEKPPAETKSKQKPAPKKDSPAPKPAYEAPTIEILDPHPLEATLPPFEIEEAQQQPVQTEQPIAQQAQQPEGKVQPQVQEIEFDLSHLNLDDTPVISVEEDKETPERGPAKQSLAEELFSEYSESDRQQEPEPERPVRSVFTRRAPVKKNTKAKKERKGAANAAPDSRTPQPAALAASAVEEQPAHEDSEHIDEQHNPNPNLANYLPKKKQLPLGLMVLFALLILLVLGGIAVMNRTMFIDPVSTKTSDMPTFHRKLTEDNSKEIALYRDGIAEFLSKSDADSAGMQRALVTLDVASIKNTISTANHDKLLEALRQAKVPVGLGMAHSELESGALERKAVATAISNALSGGSGVDPSKALEKLQAADAKVRTALSEFNVKEEPAS